jgi:SAM-dependent methyltransferase
MSSPEPSTTPEFDAFAGDYDAALQQGLSLSGEDRDFFAQGRMSWMARRFSERGFLPQSVLDFGCGTGSAYPHVSHCFPGVLYHGVDVSGASIEVARRTYPDASFSVLGELPLPSTVDLVFCNGVFHHIPLDERAQAMKSAVDALCPGGLFAFWENNPWSPAARWVMSRIPFDRHAVMVWPCQARRLLSSAGMRLIATDFQFIFPAPLSFFRRLEPALARLPLGAQYLVLAQKGRQGQR